MSKYLLLILLFITFNANASLEVRKYFSNKEVYSKSDIIAIVHTQSGEVVPLDDGGGIKVKVKVLKAIKGTVDGKVIEMHYGAGKIGGRYIVCLVWNDEEKLYEYFDPNYDIELFKVTKGEHDYSYIKNLSKNIGFKGKPIKNKDGIYYLPICNPELNDKCQLQFDHLQYMLKKIKN